MAFIPTNIPNPNTSCAVYKEQLMIITRKRVVTKKKYKPVAKKVKLVVTSVPNKFHIECNIIGNPLTNIPMLLPNPPLFTLIWHYQRMHDCTTDKSQQLPTTQRNETFTSPHLTTQWSICMEQPWTQQFQDQILSPSQNPHYPTHMLWIESNIPIPPGIYDEVCVIIHKKIKSGIYECSDSAYHSCWFCMLRKDGKVLCIVHSLELLNCVTIKHSSITPIPEHLAEQFAGWSCDTVLNLYVGYDECLIKESSHDFMTFQTPYSMMQLVMLPIGWTNSVPIFHNNVCHILQPEILMVLSIPTVAPGWMLLLPLYI